MAPNNHTLQSEFPVHTWMRLAWCLPILCGLGMSIPLQQSTVGLPIDDAYIYVKYIDNIAQGNGYSFNPGETSFGVTSFVFTVLGSAIKIAFPSWSTISICQGLGLLSLAFVLAGIQRVIYRLTGNFSLSWIMGECAAFCRPFYFTASSGLETLLFLAVAIWIIDWGLKKPEIHPVWFGIACACLYLSRPEGVYFTFFFLVGLVLYPLVFQEEKIGFAWTKMGSQIAYFLAGFSLMAFPYLAFVKWHSGHWMPMTFYGKIINRSNFLLEPWSQKIRIGFFVLLDGYKQILSQDTLPFFWAILVSLCFLSYGFFAYRCGRKQPDCRGFAVRFTMISFCLFPFLYGAVFRTSPVFGGFFVRYIQIMILLIYIESALALHTICAGLSGISQNRAVRKWIVGGFPLFLLIPLAYSVKASLGRYTEDIQYYRHHVSVNETVRKWAGDWIDQNTPPESRVFTSNSGLGAVGLYCHRFVRDEAGLINANIHPYLLGFSQGFHHWFKMLEYMKAQRIDYLTTLPPYGTDTRHTQTVAEFQDPSLKGTLLERMSRIRISRFIAPENYDLWAEYEKEAEFVDRAPQPATENRVQVTRWNEIPVLAIRTLSHQADIRQRMLFPTHAHFTAGIAFDSEREFSADDRVIVEIKVNYTEGPKLIWSKTYSLQSITKLKPIENLDIDLTPYSGKYAYLLFGTRSLGANADGVWSGWLEPKLVSVPTP